MMKSEVWSHVDKYLFGLLLSPDATLEATLADSAAAGLPAIQVAPNQGMLLHLLARVRGARSILEVGTLGGYSTTWLARALPAGGRLLSLEFSPKHAEVARANIARAGLESVVEVIVGPAAESMKRLRDEGAGPFDFIFIDADKASYPEYLELSLELSAPGTVIVADNIVRGGRVLDASSGDADVQGVRRFLERLANEPRVDATAIQTVGVKGHDGFVLARVAG